MAFNALQGYLGEYRPLSCMITSLLYCVALVYVIFLFQSPLLLYSLHEILLFAPKSPPSPCMLKDTLLSSAKERSHFCWCVINRENIIFKDRAHLGGWGRGWSEGGRGGGGWNGGFAWREPLFYTRLLPTHRHTHSEGRWWSSNPIKKFLFLRKSFITPKFGFK